LKFTLGDENMNYSDKKNGLLECEPYEQLTIDESANKGEGHWLELYNRMNPNFPGVFQVLSESDEIVYIGESKDMRELLCTYIESEYRHTKKNTIGGYIEERIEPSNLGSVKIKIYQTKIHLLVKHTMLAFHYVSTGELPKFNLQDKFAQWDRNCPVMLELLKSLIAELDS
jgi:hypothetical protein